MASELVVAPLILFLTVDFLTINGIDQTNCQVSSNQAMATPRSINVACGSRWVYTSNKALSQGTHPLAPACPTPFLSASEPHYHRNLMGKDPEVNYAAL